MKKESNIHYMDKKNTKSSVKAKNTLAGTSVSVLPNLLTTGNLFFGFFSILSSINSNFKVACYSIVIAAVFDLVDGRIAKLTNTDSDFGAQYDSLCDLISFGLAPSLLMYFWALKPFDKFGWITSFLYVSCTALRLARFNISRFHEGSFRGLPSTMAAGVIASGVLFFIENNIEMYKQVGLIFLTFLLAFLMVSDFSYGNFKGMVLKKRSFYHLVVGVLCFILLVIHPEFMLLAFFLAYMLFGWMFSKSKG